MPSKLMVDKVDISVRWQRFSPTLYNIQQYCTSLVHPLALIFYLTLAQNINALQQAAALANAQAALNNPALLMAAGTHPWLGSLSHHLGFVNPAAVAAAMGGPQLGLHPHHAAMSAMAGAGAAGQAASNSMFDTAAFAQLQLASGSGRSELHLILLGDLPCTLILIMRPILMILRRRGHQRPQQWHEWRRDGQWLDLPQRAQPAASADGRPRGPLHCNVQLDPTASASDGRPCLGQPAHGVLPEPPERRRWNHGGWRRPFGREQRRRLVRSTHRLSRV